MHIKYPSVVFTILVLYAFFGFYLSIITLYYFELDSRSAIALLKNALVVSVVFLGVFLASARARLQIIVVFVAFGISMSLNPPRILEVSLGYLVNSYIPLSVMLIAIYYRDSFVRESGSFILGIILLVFSIPLGLLVSYNLIDRDLIAIHQELKGYGVIDGYPRNWWSYIRGELYVRFSGTAEDPIYYGYLFSFVSYILIFSRKYVSGLFFFLVGLLTLVKGGAILVVLSLFLVLGWRYVRVVIGGGAEKGYFIAAFFLLIWLYILISEGSGTSANVHVLGLLLPFKNSFASGVDVSFMFGNGIGASGNLLKASLGGDIEFDEWLGGGAESSFGLIFYQVGLIGFFIFLLGLYKCFLTFGSVYSRAIWVIYWANASMQENLINLNYLAMLFVCICYVEVRSNLNMRDGYIRGKV